MSDSTPRAALAAPSPAEPLDGAVVPHDAVTFRWVAPPGASTFDLRIASASAPTETIIELEGLPTTETMLESALPAGDLLWWVRQSGGAWSAATPFHSGTLAEVEGVRQQEVKAVVEQREEKQAPGIAPVPGPPPDPVWPHVQGEALPGSPDPAWSRVPGFGDPARTDHPLAKAEAPRPLAPLGGEVVDAVSVSLEWTDVPGATGYEVELSPHADFGRDVFSIDTGTATEIGLPGLVPALGWKLLWRVRARIGDQATPWSLYGRFYPAGSDNADRFRAAMEDAHAAQRRQQDHARLVRQREMDLIPTHEREDAITTKADLYGVMGIAISGLAILAVAVVYAFWRTIMM